RRGPGSSRAAGEGESRRRKAAAAGEPPGHPVAAGGESRLQTAAGGGGWSPPRTEEAGPASCPTDPEGGSRGRWTPEGERRWSWRLRAAEAGPPRWLRLQPGRGGGWPPKPRGPRGKEAGPHPVRP